MCRTFDHRSYQYGSGCAVAEAAAVRRVLRLVRLAGESSYGKVENELDPVFHDIHSFLVTI